MTATEISPTDRYAALQRQITVLDQAYYGADENQQAGASDSTYDALMAELRLLEETRPELLEALERSGTVSVTQRVGQGAGAGEVQHLSPMLSLDNIHSAADLTGFTAKLKRAIGWKDGDPELEFTFEQKFDGLSCNLIYEDGRFQKALTRGTGVSGEDISAQMTAIGVPQSVGIRGTLEVRGEILLPTSALERINAENADSGERVFRNARNAAAGILRKGKAHLDALTFTAYGTGLSGDLQVSTQSGLMSALKTAGFHTSQFTLITDEASIETAHRQMETIRAALGHDIDGTVLKLNDLRLQREAGFTSRAPKWAIAYKFVAQEYPALLKEIRVEVGKSGRIAPLAVFEPVDVDGSTISSATLNNEDFIRGLDLRPGDTVRLRKAAGVIPEVAGRLEGAPRTSPEPFAFPTTCPGCKQPTVRPEGMADRRCTNDACPGRNFKRLLFFVERDGMNIKGLGETQLRALFDSGRVKDASDLYTLLPAELARTETTDEKGGRRMIGTKVAEKLITEIEKSKSRELRHVIMSLGLRHTGRGTSKRVAAVAGDLPGLLALSETELAAITDIGPTTARAFHSELHAERTFTMLKRMVDAGVSPAAASNARAGDGLAGLTFVITGTLSQSRGAFESHIEKYGGRASGSVTRKTSYLLLGENGGGKADKATELGIRMLSETEFSALLSERGVPGLS